MTRADDTEKELEYDQLTDLVSGEIDRQLQTRHDALEGMKAQMAKVLREFEDLTANVSAKRSWMRSVQKTKDIQPTHPAQAIAHPLVTPGNIANGAPVPIKSRLPSSDNKNTIEPLCDVEPAKWWEIPNEYTDADINELEIEKIAFESTAREIIQVLTKQSSDWWFGETCNGTRGLFPASYVEEITHSSTEETETAASGDQAFDAGEAEAPQEAEELPAAIASTD
ncbi:hypothetical protein ATCC90586_009320 [Pythium insidiosum]|nr:hypothetical protein ATCC90586_009320 [Pythium insidiosum]